MPETMLTTAADGSAHLYAELTRVDDDERLVEGFAYVNETVPGDSVRWRRSAMEEATPDYLRWGALRVMHRAEAAGTTSAVEWKPDGAFIRARVVDDAAWRMVKAGVYKGFSVGISPTLLRNGVVEKCRWIETSLVDRPKDPDAVVTLARLDTATESDPVEAHTVALEAHAEALEAAPTEERVQTPAEAAIEEAAPAVRAEDSSTVPVRENLEGGQPRGDTHYDCGADDPYCHGHTTRGGAVECQDKQKKGLEDHISMVEEHLNSLRGKRADELLTDSILTADATRADTAGDYGSHSDAGYADPGYQDDKKPRYPLKEGGKYSAERVRAAWSYIHQEKNRGEYSSEELARIEARIRAAAKAVGVELSEDDDRAEEAMVLRAEIDTTRAEIATLSTRLEESAASVTRLEGCLAAAEARAEESATRLATAAARIAELEAMPADAKPPVRYPSALTREFLARQEEERLGGAEFLRGYTEALAEGEAARKSGDEAAQRRVVARMLSLKQQAAELGIALG